MVRQTQTSQQYADLAVILVRKTDDDIPGAPPWEEQQARCRAYCQERNYGIVSLVIENGPPPLDFGVSQRRFPKEYPGIAEAFRFCRRGQKAGVIVCTSADRITLGWPTLYRICEYAASRSLRLETVQGINLTEDSDAQYAAFIFSQRLRFPGSYAHVELDYEQ